MRNIVGVFLVLALAAVPLLAQDPPPVGAAAGPGAAVAGPAAQAASRLDRVGEVLLIFLVLSVIFEVALTPIFNWRVFIARFEGKGVKTPITVVLALLVFWTYDLDVLRDVLVALGYEATLSFWGQVITALLIAGGSDGVFRIFAKLGIRNPVERVQKAQEAQAAVAAKPAPAGS